MNRLKFKIRKNSLLLILLVLFFYYLIIAYNLKLNSSPDELLRYKIPLYIYKHGILPVGTDTAVMLPFGNYSYAYYPQLLGGIISAVFMKAFSLFTVDSQALVFAARLTSVCFGLLTVYFTALSAQIVTKSKKWSLIAALLVGVLPQFAYLSGYVNNDIISIAGASIILYSIIYSIYNGWNYKSALTFAMGAITCLLGYLNSVPFVFLGGIYAIYILIKQVKQGIVNKRKSYYILAYVFIVIIIFTFPFYFRNYYLYHDFFGNQAFLRAYNRWINNGGQPTMHPFSGSIITMLWKTDWIKVTFESTIGMFGYYEYFLNLIVYIFYLLFFYTGLFLKSFNEQVTIRKSKLSILLICIIIFTLFLSAYRSKTTDYQPQGRYILTILPIIILWCIEGFQWLAKKLKSKSRIFLTSAISIYILISLAAILHYVILNVRMIY
ncbi:MAG: hypothetical protein ACI4UB_06015 [Limosilactobacillus sp.]